MAAIKKKAYAMAEPKAAKAKEIKKGMHKMPNGKMMKNSDMKKK
jgi:hypothetical protein